MDLPCCPNFIEEIRQTREGGGVEESRIPHVVKTKCSSDAAAEECGNDEKT